MTSTVLAHPTETSILKLKGRHVPKRIGELHFDSPTPGQLSAQLATLSDAGERERLMYAAYVRLFDEVSARLSRP
jgi:hypothetical protein